MTGDKSKDYVNEHIHLLKKYQKELSLSKSEMRKSVRIRKFRNFAAGVYLKLFVRK